MELDRKRVSKAFREFLASYDMNDPDIKRKAVHTVKTAENCVTIAGSAGKDADLAWLIGILHDLGRFPQVAEFHTFWDASSIDHAALGADILFKGGYVRNFTGDETVYPVIEKAVRYHSAYQLPDGLTEEERIYCDIIRDADKLDIFRVFAEAAPEEIFKTSREQLLASSISDPVMEQIRKRRTVKHALKKTPADRFAGIAALGFELKFPVTRSLAKGRGDLDRYTSMRFSNEDTDKKRIEIRALLGL
ncbi:MAG: HD domain-containing protein [Anaerovoracaceae bacterium]|nr:HD domain-containing protein [Bacillota bacterium]MDY2670402.1 HD domain-containing protein [Anaerovoracaceae bacterium]